MISAGPAGAKTIENAVAMAIHMIHTSDNVIVTRHKKTEDF